MSKASVSISGLIDLGTAWHIGNFGSNDIITLTADDPGNITRMQLTATRTRGVMVVRTDGDDDIALASVFCVDTGVEFNLSSVGNYGTCSVGETQVIIADVSNSSSIDDWDAKSLKADIIHHCTYTGGCTKHYITGPVLDGVYMNGFDTVNISSSNSHLGLSLEF